MAGQSNRDSSGEEVVQLLKETLKSIQGTVDFARVAAKIGAPNAEAARKRLKRFFKKDEEPLLITGSTLGNTDTTPKPAKKTAAPKSTTTKIAKVKQETSISADENDGDDQDGDNDVLADTSPKKSAAKKRKAKDGGAAAAAKKKRKIAKEEKSDVEEKVEAAED